MIEALQLKGHETVLEIGTGYGYQTALLAKLARRVVSVERISELAEVAMSNLVNEGVANAEVVVGDGTLGLSDLSPFDAIIVAAAFTSVPEPLVRPARPRGTTRHANRKRRRRSGQGIRKTKRRTSRGQMLCGARFVPLLGANGFQPPKP